MACGQEAAGLLVLEDAVRPEAKVAVGRLNELGLRTVLISGDNRTTAERIAAELGISGVHAEVLPELSSIPVIINSARLIGVRERESA